MNKNIGRADPTRPQSERVELATPYSRGKENEPPFLLNSPRHGSSEFKRRKPSSELGRTGDSRAEPNSPRESRLFCLNHGSRSAKYKTVDEDDCQQSHYCMKCAIRLVSQGFKVAEIREEDNEHARGLEIKSLLEDTETSRIRLQKQQHLLKRMRGDFEAGFEERIAGQEAAFGRLLASIEQARRASRRELEEQRSLGLSELEEVLEEVANSLCELKAIKDELQPNFDRLKRQLGFQRYRAVIANCQDRLRSVLRSSETSMTFSLAVPAPARDPDAAVLQLIFGRQVQPEEEEEEEEGQTQEGQPQEGQTQECQGQSNVIREVAQEEDSFECDEQLTAVVRPEAFRSLFRES